MELKTMLKGQGHPRTGYEGPDARWVWVGWSKLRPGRFTPGNKLASIVQEAGLSPGPVWKDPENIAHQRDSISRPSKAVTSGYTYYSIPVPTMWVIIIDF